MTVKASYDRPGRMDRIVDALIFPNFEIFYMFDIVMEHSLTWVLRSLFIVGVYLAIRVGRGIGVSDCGKFDALGKRCLSLNASSDKPHVSKISERPLMTITESPIENPVQNYSDNLNMSQFSRESLLATLTNVEIAHKFPLTLFRQPLRSATFRVSESHTDLHQVSELSVVNQEDERANLQSLLQFRVFKGVELFGDDWEKWNNEARRILKAAHSLGAPGISLEVRNFLLSAGVLPDLETYTALVQAATAASEVLTARSILGEMSQAGYVVDADLVRSVENSIDFPTGKRFNKNAPVFIPRH